MNNLLTSKDLAINEFIIYEAKLHWISYITPISYITIGFLGFVPLFTTKGLFQVFGLLLVFLCFKGIYIYWTYKNLKIQLSENVLTITTGILNRSVIDLLLNKMEGMVLYQSFLGKLLNYGILKVSTGEISYKYVIEAPLKLREKVIKTIPR